LGRRKILLRLRHGRRHGARLSRLLALDLGERRCADHATGPVVLCHAQERGRR
jgi:hypothetical protein